ncbi:hypothetical protein [Actibacterium ureilyticum]|uniref:hypothetical protein n=1 Tax=Actibacterium ureilyticum TaxID=1590614 RepID=UPI000BAAC895|nr:hypothetical protein [Actibacterium ureilyticum]
MMISIGLAIGAGTTAEDAEPPVLPDLALNDFSRDRTLFDSGIALGANTADIALSGTGSSGEVVEARALSVDDGGATSTAWTPVATIDGNGDWSGQISAPRSASWYRAQVRIQSAPVVARQSTSRFGVGHVIAIWGQSEDARFHSSFHDATTPPAILDDEAVQYMYFDGGVQHSQVTGATPVTSAVAAMANTFAAERPGEKFAIVAHTVSGTDPRHLVNDSDAGRNWADDLALHTYATADGQSVGMAAWSWFAAPGSLGSNYEEALFPLFTGLEQDGTPFAVPGTLTYGAGSTISYDHSFTELYDPAYTRWIAHGPHRFDITEAMQDATHLANGSVSSHLNNKQLARDSWRAMIENPNAGGIFLPYGIELLSYLNGRPDGAGGWEDTAHPAGEDPDGLQRRARFYAHAILQASGMVGWAVPEFDQAAWEPGGAYVEVWSSAGPVTTTRIARGETPLDDTFPHWTDVAGWQINGLPAERAEIVAGRVRIYPNGGGVFTFADQINYGLGGATGMIAYPDDHYAALWKDIPLVDTGAAGVEGIPLRALPDPDVLANTLTAPQSFDVDLTGPYFKDTDAVGTGITGVTMEAELSFGSGGTGFYDLFFTNGAYLRLEVRPSNGQARVQVRDSSGTNVIALQQVSNVTPAIGVTVTLRFAVNFTLGWARIFVDDVLTADLPFASAGTGQMSDSRYLQFFEGAGLIAQVQQLSAWKEATADGSRPVSTPYKVISGAPATVNADPWKLGTDAV